MFAFAAIVSLTTRATGVSRSGAVVVALLMAMYGEGLDKALARAKQKRSKVVCFRATVFDSKFSPLFF